MSTSESGGVALTRRTFVRAAGAGVAGLGSLGVATRAAATPARANPQGTNEVNLYVRPQAIKFDGRGVGQLDVTVGNYGPNATKSPVRDTVISPFFVNWGDRLPPGAKILFLDKSPWVPSIVEITVAEPIEVGKEIVVQLPTVLLNGAPSVGPDGMASALPTGQDTDTDIVRNSKLFGVVSPPPAPGNVDLYFIHQTATFTGRDPVFTVFDMYNGGPNVTSSPARFVFWTGFYYNFAFGKAGPPPGTKLLYSDPRPDVPEIVSVQVPAGFPIGTAYPVILPIKAVPVVHGDTGRRTECSTPPDPTWTPSEQRTPRGSPTRSRLRGNMMNARPHRRHRCSRRADTGGSAYHRSADTFSFKSGGKLHADLKGGSGGEGGDGTYTATAENLTFSYPSFGGHTKTATTAFRGCDHANSKPTVLILDNGFILTKSD